MKTIQIPRRFEATSWGGTETVILETSRLLLEMGHDTSILCPSALSNPGLEQIDGLPVRRVPYFYPYWGLTKGATEELDQRGGNLFSWSLMRELVREPGLDLIHLHTGKRLGGGARLAAKWRRIPYVVSLHGGFLDVPSSESERYVRPTRGAFEWGRALGWLVGSRRVLDDAGAIITVGRSEAELLRARFPNKLVVHLPNGVDVARFKVKDGPGFRARHGILSSTFLLTVVGRIDPQKNQSLALGVLSHLRAAGVDAHLALVGATTNNAYMDSLVAEIRQMELGPHVTFTGNLAREEVPSAYHAADLVLLPSIHEPFGIAVLEAWASGKAILVSKVGGVPDLVDHNRNGLLFESNDLSQAANLAQTLQRDPEFRARLAAAGKMSVAEHSWARITKQLVDLYCEVITREAANRRKESCASA